MRLQVGEQVDRYVVEGILGEGGMAVVYLVRHLQLDTRHALKVLQPRSPEMRLRMLREGRLQATLRHPNIVAVTDVLEVGGATALLLELVEGPSLRELCERRKLGLDEALATFRGIVSGVGHAHARGMIHRDLKPENVLMARIDGALVPKVTDFGLVKEEGGGHDHRTRTGTTVGTPAYMSPEQINDTSKVDRRADLWSLGCLLYELVTGDLPFDSPDLLSLFQKIAVGRYESPFDARPDLPVRVGRAIEALLRSDVADRVAECADVLRYLDGTLDALTPSGVPLAALPPAQPMPAALGPTAIADDGTAVPGPTAAPRRTPAPATTYASDASTGSPETGADPRVSGAAQPRQPTPPWVLPAAMIAWVPVVGLLAWAASSRVGGAPPVVAEPVAAPVAAVAAAPEPAPVPPPAPEPAPVAVAPAPPPKPVARPAPPAPAPAATTGRVTFEGADAIEFVEGDVRLTGPELPAGRYQVFARFPGRADLAGAGYVTVTVGGEHHLRCVPQMTRCTAVR